MKRAVEFIKNMFNTSNNASEETVKDKKTAPRVKKTNAEILATPVDKMNGYEFERLIAMYFKDKGYETEVTKVSGTYNVDIVLNDPKDNYKIAVQCKCWRSKKVGHDLIYNLHEGQRAFQCNEAWSIAIGDFTNAAYEVGKEKNIQLMNRKQLDNTIVKWQNQQ